MPITLARAVMPDVDGVAADQAVNDFVFAGSLSNAAMAANVVAFYNSIFVLGTALAAFIGNSRSRVVNACTVELYDISAALSGGPHGSPIDIVPWTLGAATGGVDMPRQAAICISTHALFGSTLEHGPTASRPTPEAAQDDGAPATHLALTRPKSSLRGRIFVGPLDSTTLDTPGTVSLNAWSVAGGAASGLLIADPSWSVWSRVTASTHPITGGWVDKDFSVIRRRKLKTPSRFVWG